MRMCAKRAASVVVGVALLLTGCDRLKTPETSALFEKFADPESGVVSYVLKPGLLGWNQQSIYFTQRSMTDDGRFLVFTVAEDERTYKKPEGTKDMPRHLAVVDFAKDVAYRIEDDLAYTIPFVDCREDRIYYVNRADETFCYRDLKADPKTEVKMFKMPSVAPPGMRLRSWYTHLTLSADRRFAFLDIWCKDKDGNPHCQEGLLSLADGSFSKWCDLDFLADHGQINPVDPTQALGAWEQVRVEKDASGKPRYRRMWLYNAAGQARNVPSQAILHATHEIWSDDGKSFYWCSRAPDRDKYGVYRYDLATGAETCVSPEKAMHAMISPDGTRLVYDWPLPPLGRGSPWSVSYQDLKTGRIWKIFSRRPALVEPGGKSTLHPDPHPQFVMNAKYIVSTMNGDDHRMNLAVTPVDQFK